MDLVAGVDPETPRTARDGRVAPILGLPGRLYPFSSADWMSHVTPRRADSLAPTERILRFVPGRRCLGAHGARSSSALA